MKRHRDGKSGSAHDEEAGPREPGPPSTDGAATEDVEPTRWELLRDIFTFQVKLAIDGLRDLLLSPLSLMAGLIGGLLLGDRKMFYRLVHMGRRSERWINLFGAADRMPNADPTETDSAPPPDSSAPQRDAGSAEADGRQKQLPAVRGAPRSSTRPSSGLDDILARVEGLMAEQVRQGGLTATAKQTIDRALNAMEAQSEVVKARELLGPGQAREAPAATPDDADQDGPPPRPGSPPGAD